MSGPVPFDEHGPLPGPGLTSIQASAGTGKTHALAGLATRFVTEGGRDIADLLVVTFTRAAAGELRTRIRQRLNEIATEGPDSKTSDSTQRRARQAIESFDAATITTIHGFCSTARSLLGISGGADMDATLVTGVEPLVRSACADVLAGASLGGTYAAGTLPTVDKLAELVTVVLNNPGIKVVVPKPGQRSEGPKAVVQAELVGVASTEVRRRLAEAGQISFDYLITDIAAAVRDDAAAKALARRFPVLLIDEFQDTDLSQWEVFAAMAAADPDEMTVVVVGDPKQAIYAFRGGNVHAYRRAVGDDSVKQLTLTTNWRSDATMIAAANQLLAPLDFGYDDIVYQHVSAAPPNEHKRLTIIEAGERKAVPAIDVRCVVDPGLPRNSRGISIDDARKLAYDDLARRVAELLRTGEIEDSETKERKNDTETKGGKKLVPSEVAVLVSQHSNTPIAQAALAAHGIASVAQGGTRLVDTAAARQWDLLLAAMAAPTDLDLVRAATLGWAWRWELERLAAATETDLTRVQEVVTSWADLVRTEGVAALVANLTATTDMVPETLSRPQGLRDLTDFTHLGELLDRATGGRGTTAAAVRGVLRELDDTTGDDDLDEDDLQRRMDLDGEAVRIITMHAAKGLQFEVVCCADLSSPKSNRSKLSERNGVRCLELGEADRSHDPENGDFSADHEHRAEQRRLAYVALTRARHHLMVWWMPTAGANKTALAHLLFPGDQTARGDLDSPANVPSPEETVDVLRERFPHGNELVEVSVATAGPPTTAPAMTPAPEATKGPDRSGTADLSAATLGRVVTPRGGRWSFTALASRRLDSHGSAAATNPDDDSLGDRGGADEPTGDPGGDPAGVSAPDVTTGDVVGTGEKTSDTPEVLMPWGLAGADFGTRVHTVLERVDFTSGDLPDALAGQVTATGAVPGAPGAEGTTRQHRELVTALTAAVATPLGPAFAGPDGERSLGTLRRSDRLDELEFDLSLTMAPDNPEGPTLGSILGVVASHLGPDDPVGAWAHHASGLARPFPVTGYLTGSIDLVARITTPDGDEKFCAMDYKTNRLEPAPGTTDNPGITAYAPDALTGAMASHHYPLQALVYGVALYRYLRWRLPRVDPDTVIGPVGYLFLRGMVGPYTPTGNGGGRYGVFAWQPPPGLLANVSNHLSGIRAATAGATP